MHIRYIESFLVLFEELNFSKACHKLYISQQGLSRQIQTLEKELNTTLFKRSKSGLVPTEICLELYPHFLDIRNAYSVAKSKVAIHNYHLQKPLTIAFAYGITRGLNTDVILNFQEEYPDINFRIKEWSKKKCIDKLQANEADIAFLVNPFDLSMFETYDLVEGYMYVAIHKDHPLSKYNELNFAALHKETIVTGSEDNVLRELFDHYCQLLNVQPNIKFSSSHNLDIINSNTDPLLIATVTPIMVDRITNKAMRIVRLNTPEPGILYCCVSKTREKSQDLDQVINFIKTYFNEISVIKIKDE